MFADWNVMLGCPRIVYLRNGQVWQLVQRWNFFVGANLTCFVQFTHLVLATALWIEKSLLVLKPRKQLEECFKSKCLNSCLLQRPLPEDLSVCRRREGREGRERPGTINLLPIHSGEPLVR